MLIIVFLVLLNGILAMAEIAIVTSKKYRLERLVAGNNVNAKIALDLANSPTKFLSIIQAGITIVSIFAGAFGELSVTANLSSFLSTLPVIASYSEIVARLVVVVTTGYLLLIFGELVPKRIAMHSPERIAVILAPFMNILSFAASPLVTFLTISTDAILVMANVKKTQSSIVTEEEVKMLIKEGVKTGVFELTEREIVERTLKLGDKKVSALMTARKEIISFHQDTGFQKILDTITTHPHSSFPVVGKTLDDIIGVVRTKTLLMNFLENKKTALEKSMIKPLIVPEYMNGLKALEMFKKSDLHMAIVVDEYGSVEGVISLTDILEAIVGDIPSDTEPEEDDIVKRKDGSYLVSGLVTLDEFSEFFVLPKFKDEKLHDVHSVGGLVVSLLGKVPVVGDTYEWNDIRFEVVDMDGSRVDKVIVNNTATKISIRRNE